MSCSWVFDWGSIPDWVVAGLAGLAAAIAWSQLRAAARSAHDQAQIARASLILQIDLDFESPEMLESRLALRGLRNEIESFVKTQNESLHNSALQDEINNKLSQYMNILWDDFRQADKQVIATQLRDLVDTHLKKIASNPEEVQPHEKAGVHYQRLTKIFGWLERVGHMANERLLPQQDIVALYDFVFVELVGWFEGHIKYRREDGPLLNPDFLKQTTNFRDAIVRSRGAPKLVEPSAQSGVSGFGGG